MKNLFVNHIRAKTAKPALEMEPNDPVKPTNVDALADVKKIDSEFEGLKTDKKPEDQNLEISKEVKIGTEPAFDKEQEDYVAQGQEEGLALEAIAESARRDLKLARRHRNRQYALEDIAEVVQTTLDGESPVQDVEPADVKEPGIEPASALAIQRALDMDELGDEEQQSVAIESFGFSRVAATESLIDRVVNRSNESKGESRSLVKRAAGKMSNFGQRVSKALKGSAHAADAVANDMRDVGDAVLARAVLSDKAKNKVRNKVYAVNGARTPTDCLRGSVKQLTDLEALSDAWPKAVGRINDAVSAGEDARIIAACNDALKFLKRVADTAGSKLPSMGMKLKSETVNEGSSYKDIDYDYTDGSEAKFEGDFGNAKFSDLEEVRGAISRADRALDAAWSEDPSKRLGAAPARAAAGDGTGKAAKRIAKEVIIMGSDLVGGAIFNTAWAVHMNADGIAQWGVETIAAARNTRNQ